MAKVRNVLAFAAVFSAFTWGSPTFAAQSFRPGNDPCAGLRGIRYLDCQRAVAATRAAARWRTYQRKLETWRQSAQRLLFSAEDSSSGPRPILYDKRATCIGSGFYYVPGTDTCIRSVTVIWREEQIERSQLEAYRSGMPGGHFPGEVLNAEGRKDDTDPQVLGNMHRDRGNGFGGGLGGRN